jgi:alcohol dehydrogenase YqhD (iron-dependent ADH family)
MRIQRASGVAQPSKDASHTLRAVKTEGGAGQLGPNDGRKLGLISPHLIPRRAICDRDLTLGLPPRLTAATGMDALSHCIETFLSPRFNPPSRRSRSTVLVGSCAISNGQWRTVLIAKLAQS